jgi:Lon protease-like protein
VSGDGLLTMRTPHRARITHMVRRVSRQRVCCGGGGGGLLAQAARGQERVRVTKVIQELPVMLAEVEPLEDEADVMGAHDEPLEQLAASVAALFKALLELTTRLYNEPALEPPEEVRSCVGAAAARATHNHSHAMRRLM